MQNNNKHTLSALNIALTSILFGSAFSAVAQSSATTTSNAKQDFEILEVTGRLRSSAFQAREERRQENTVVDILGADQISRSGDSDAAGALKRITGLTLKDGKFIYVRGLGERYSSTSLNGATVPSPDPTRNVVPLDMFPAGIIDSLFVQKASSADRPAAFGGGHVDIRTKTIKSDTIFKLNIGTEFSANDNKPTLGYPGSQTDNLGYDDGKRALAPDIIDTINQYHSLTDWKIGGREVNRDLVMQLNRDFTITEQRHSQPIKGSLTYGTQFDMSDDIRFGFVSALSYNKKSNNVEKQKTDLIKSDSGLATFASSNETGTEHSIKQSGMLNTSIELGANHTIATHSTYLRDTSDSVFVNLNTDTDSNDNQQYQDFEISYQERRLISNQLSGEHFIDALGDLQVNWRYSHSRASLNAPSNVSYHYMLTQQDDGSTVSSFRTSDANAPTLSFTRLDDLSNQFALDLSYPIELSWAELTMQGGINLFNKERDNSGTKLQLSNDFSSDMLTQPFSELFSDQNVQRDALGIQVGLAPDNTQDYQARDDIYAGYLMADLDIDDIWLVNAGIRYEQFSRETATYKEDGTLYQPPGASLYQTEAMNQRDESDIYPQASLTYKVDSEHQMRFALSKTVVRPDLREVAPIRYDDPDTGFEYIGNPQLQSSNMFNFDARYEMYGDNGNSFSFGGFYKSMTAPIEPVQQISEADTLLKFYNTESGTLYGLETEFLFGLDSVTDSWLSHFFISGNLTLGDSEIEVGNIAGTSITNSKRAMTGHSKWVTNLQVSFDSPLGDHSANLVYNISAKRIAFAGSNGLDDVYEQPFSSLDFTYSYFATDRISLKLKGKNLLNNKTEYQQEGVAVYAKQPGQTASIELSYSL